MRIGFLSAAPPRRMHSQILGCRVRVVRIVKDKEGGLDDQREGGRGNKKKGERATGEGNRKGRNELQLSKDIEGQNGKSRKKAGTGGDLISAGSVLGQRRP